MHYYHDVESKERGLFLVRRFLYMNAYLKNVNKSKFVDVGMC